MVIIDTIVIETPLGSPNTLFHILANEISKPNHPKTPTMRKPPTIPKIMDSENFILLIFSPFLLKILDEYQATYKHYIRKIRYLLKIISHLHFLMLTTITTITVKTIVIFTT